MKRKHLVVIGGGIGGYAAALRAARAGAVVTLIERAQIGGVCLNRGCIPSKVYLHGANLLHEARKAQTFGLSGTLEADLAAMKARKEQIVSQLTTGVTALLRSGKVQVINGSARFTSPDTIVIAESGKTLRGDIFVVATGSSPVRLPIKSNSAAALLTSDQLLDMDEPPESLLIVGGGYIGVELGQFFSRIGTRVTIVERAERIVPTEDAAVADGLQKALAAEGVKILTGAEVEEISLRGATHSIIVAKAGEKVTLAASKVAQTVGRAPDVSGLGLDTIGVRLTERGAVLVDDRMRTSLPHIYAVGDCTGGILLAHVAAAEAEIAVENALGNGNPISYRAVPRCIYTDPEVACVGLTEEQARAEHNDVQVANFPLRAVGKALIADGADGMVKIVADGEHGEILGVHIIGPHATELISEAVLAIGLECTVEEVARAIHPHPTLSEAMGEAAMMLSGGALHLP